MAEETYQWLWDNMVILKPETVKTQAAKIYVNIAKYQQVVDGTKIPWQFIAVTHYRESSLSFTRHPHNGDPLTARTKQVPAGRPTRGEPPFTWEESAKDAYIMFKKLDKIPLWDIETILFELEKFNGLGYKKYHPEVLSPYLWSYTQFYIKGKYASDGHFDKGLVDKQIGCVPLYKYLTDETLGVVVS